MTHKRIIVFSLFLIINSCNFFAFSNEIIPNPDSQVLKGGDFILSNNTSINYPDDFKISAEFLKEFIQIGENHNNSFTKLFKFFNSGNEINFIKYLKSISLTIKLLRLYSRWHVWWGSHTSCYKEIIWLN